MFSLEKLVDAHASSTQRPWMAKNMKHRQCELPTDSAEELDAESSEDVEQQKEKQSEVADFR